MDTSRGGQKGVFQAFIDARNSITDDIKDGSRRPRMDLESELSQSPVKLGSDPHHRNSSICASLQSSSSRRSTLLISTCDEDGRVSLGEDLSLNSASSLYSTASQKHAAKERTRMRDLELRKIRVETKAVQAQIRTKVNNIRAEAVRTLRPDADLERELAAYETGLRRMKEVIQILLLESQLKRVCDTTASNLLSTRSSPSHNRPKELQQTDALETVDQLAKMKTEISELKRRFFIQELERKQQTENLHRELEAQVRTLKGSFQSWEEEDELQTESGNVRNR